MMLSDILKPFYSTVHLDQKKLLVNKCLDYIKDDYQNNYQEVIQRFDDNMWVEFVSINESKEITSLFIGMVKLIQLYPFDEVDSISELIWASLSIIFFILDITN